MRVEGVIRTARPRREPGHRSAPLLLVCADSFFNAVVSPFHSVATSRHAYERMLHREGPHR